MPPQERATLSQEALRLVDLLAHYFDLMEKHSEQICSLPNGEALYNSANSQWMEDPFITPLAGDATQKTAYFARCDAMIESTPVTIEEYVFGDEYPYMAT
ncbi:hypothetical protein FIBSPDRAFT_850239 [Athelia psychrophila]|uniref:Uncharacterized protein n=1 Tax=Athelia psychrophila TaxID=1759441 RepID=A0A166TN15_9AGAM|nr:hypothetical protein FIBSPDRAFT_850239 [Fibularhizoctonia sp. CBS 109695]